jgi:hypothetical protein
MDDILAMAGSLADSRKDYAAAQMETLAESFRQFAGTIPAIPTMRAYAGAAADSLDELADYVVESDLADMLDDARGLMQRHPLAAFGGSIAAGLIVTQLIQSRGFNLRGANANNGEEVAGGDDDEETGPRRRPGRRSTRRRDDKTGETAARGESVDIDEI